MAMKYMDMEKKMEFKARKRRWIRITDTDTKQVNSEILFAQHGGIRRQKAALPHVPLEKGSDSWLPDVPKGKPGMHWNWARPHHRGEIQLGINLDFLRKSIKSIAESWEGVVGKRNSTLPEFILLFLLHFPVLGWGEDPHPGCGQVWNACNPW